MALLVEHGTAALRTTVGSQTVNLSTFGGETPKILIVRCYARTADGAGATFGFSYGIALSATSRFCVAQYSLDAQPNDESYGRHDNANVITLIDGVVDPGDVLLEVDLGSFGADQFVLDVDKTDGTAYDIFYEVYGGSDITAAELVEASTDTITGNQTFSGAGGNGTPSFAIMTSIHNLVAAPDSTTEVSFSIGITDGSFAKHVTLFHSGGAAITDASQWINNGMLGEIGTSQLEAGEFGLVGFVEDGLTVSCTNGFPQDQLFWLLLVYGPTAKVGVFRADQETTLVNVNAGINAQCMSLFSCNQAESATSTTDSILTTGSSDGSFIGGGGWSYRDSQENTITDGVQDSNGITGLTTTGGVQYVIDSITPSDPTISVSFSNSPAGTRDFAYYALGSASAGLTDADCRHRHSHRHCFGTR